MFVSSYNTYIAHKPSTKIEESTQRENEKSSSSEKKLFSTELEKVVSSSAKIPLNYISSYKSLNNQQLLQQQNELNKDYSKIKFEKINKITSAQNAYSENSKLFPLLQKPKIALAQEVKQPKNIQQNSVLKQKFINTYIANDNYYKVTAA
ncbi:hypothetical protein [Sulfurimonas autotrophica]|uniref:Uncharacterized protein n=1 Tax=Sulfurimonas autotrophica (strain ATCC BAA-671 / DSM 16294 / JCM 11897 / OK10) TaxID=563040 RepID=E0UPQ4_SULAO|nr:hypothetical protein [Sulfurimonas autotrophica]ADN08646.1 conserved hypothetical protein [Sulfurimonas autotrophica DSM 16294]